MNRKPWQSLVGIVILAVAALAIPLITTPAAFAATTPIHIAGTDNEGVLIRPSANTSQPAVGWAPEGASPTYICFTYGQVINNVPIWFQIQYNGVNGFYPSAYDDSSYSSDAELTAKYGVPSCESSSPVAEVPSPATAAASRESVFYIARPEQFSPLNLGRIATHDIPYSGWKSANVNADCTWNAAVAATPANASILAGWSIGRLGVAYFLAGASPERVARVHSIVLFDPGNRGDFADSCDARYDIDGLYASWLRSDPSNRLIIFAGRYTEDKSVLHQDFAGLWDYYFPALWNQQFAANQVIVCDYDNMEHDAILENFHWAATNPPNSCPADPRAGYVVQQWHP